MSYIGSKPADAVLETDDITDGVITTSKLADNSVTTAKTSYSDAPFRNIIINGDMSIAQRGTSATGLTNGSSGLHTVDRWRFGEAGSPTGEFTQSQSTDVPTGQGFVKSLKMDCTTAQGSLAAADGLRIEQRFEGQNLQYLKKGTANAESVTVSFWVKSNKTGTYIAEIFDNDNSRQISKAYTIDSANTWEKKTMTYAGDTSGALDNDNSHSLDVRLWLGAGTDFTSGTLNTSWNSVTTANRLVGQVNLADSTSNEWYITGVQLEVGSAASDFEFLPYDVNLGRCERYYQVFNYVSGSAICIGNSNTSTTAVGAFDFNTMRTAPTATLPTAGQTTNTASYLAPNGAYPTTTGTFTAESINIKNFRLKGNSYSGLNSGAVSWCYSNGNTSIKLDAEL